MGQGGASAGSPAAQPPVMLATAAAAPLHAHASAVAAAAAAAAAAASSSAAAPPQPPLDQPAREPAPPPDAWQLEYLASLARQEQLQRAAPPAWPVRVLRSSQLDALRLDAELLAMLREQANAVFARFRPGAAAAYEPELDAALRLLVFKLSVWAGRATPGSELMNLRYRDERALARAANGSGGGGGGAAAAPAWLNGGRTGIEGPGLSRCQRILFGVGYVLAPYLWERATRMLAARDDWRGGGGGFGGGFGRGGGSNNESAAAARRAAAWKLLRWLESAYKVGAAANLLAFLVQGRYRSLLERVLGARLVYREPSYSRAVSFEYLNRQLVWQELSDFMLFLLPLVSAARVKRAALRWFPRLPLLAAAGGGGGGAAAASWTVAAADDGDDAGGGGSGSAAAAAAAAVTTKRGNQQRGVAASIGGAGAEGEGEGEDYEPPGPCPICGLREIAVPYAALPCRHVFCYYCLRAHCEADAAFECPVDGRRVAAMRRFAGRRAR